MFDITLLEENKQKIQKDFTELSPFIEALKVVDKESLTLATEYAWKAQGRIKRIEELRVEFKEPVLKIGRMIDTWAKNLGSPYELALDNLKGKMKAYHLEQDRLAKIEQDRIRKEQEAQRKAQEEKDRKEKEKLIEAQKTATPEQVQEISAVDLIMWSSKEMTPIVSEIVVKHDSKSKTESGSSFTRKVWKFELQDIHEVLVNILLFTKQRYEKP